jgi:protein-disulfide isomerase
MNNSETRRTKWGNPLTRKLVSAAVIALFFYLGVAGLGAIKPSAEETALPGEALTPQQEQEVLRLFQRYMSEHPEDVVKALENYAENEKADRANKIQETLAQGRAEIERDEGSFVAGNPNGNISLVEFFDYRCSYCKRSHDVVQELLEQDGNIRFVYKEFPILGPDSVLASQAALASRKQGKYLDFHNALMTSRGALNRARIMEIAEDTGVDVDRLATDMKDPEIVAIISRNNALARRLDIGGTPAFIIGDQLLAGAADIGRFKTLVAEARTNCKTC